MSRPEVLAVVALDVHSGRPCHRIAIRQDDRPSRTVFQRVPPLPRSAQFPLPPPIPATCAKSAACGAWVWHVKESLALALLTSGIHLLASLSVALFLFVFHKAQA